VIRSLLALILVAAAAIHTLRAQSEIETLPVHGQVSLISAGGLNVAVPHYLPGEFQKTMPAR